MKKIIILVGESGGGKDAVAGILSEDGFTKLSVSDEVRKRVSEVGITNPTRADWREQAKLARKTFGPDYFAKRVVDTDGFKDNQILVINGVRHPSEIDAIRNAGESDLHIWAVTASPETRYRRVTGRNDATGVLSFNEFVAGEMSEMNSPEEGGQQTQACMEMATYTILNEQDEEDFASLRRMVSDGLELSHHRRKEEL